MVADHRQPGVDGEPPLPENWDGDPRLAIFLIPLLDSVPLPHGSTFTFFREEEVPWLESVTLHLTPQGLPLPYEQETQGKNFVSVKVWRLKEQLCVPREPLDMALKVASEVIPGVRQPSDEVRSAADITLRSEDSFSAVFELVTPLLPRRQHGKIDVNHTIDNAFDRCIESLTQLVRAYMVMSDDLRVMPPSRNSVFPVLLWTTRNPEASDWGGVGLYLPNPGYHVFPTPTGDLTASQMDDLGKALTRVMERDPMAVFAEHARASRRAFQIRSDYAAAVIEAQISAEVLFDAVLLMMAWEEGTSPEDAALWFEEGLSKRIRTHYGPRLGGNWNTSVPTSVVGRWAKRVRDLRNRVAHRGYWPSENETFESLRAMDELEAFVKQRVASKRNVYPRTSLVLLGKPGLERLGLYRGRIKSFVETTAAKEPSWLHAYGGWVEALDACRK